ncbi:acyltransferase family protein [Lamprobacter modestohalophilus]|uniref:acyltransferase family protein n=1 Tax=Lamprobacter modestohalophilus TaxID=1064514 RepID=UPI002ADED3D1|nr:acyltransferase family protein [Lamprobacter modestohalophilus]MEA1050983.1 acyltransferase family protein [Lamprobacter modestohalophilus]
MIRHQHFIDWMKATGMFIIVYGHVLGNLNHYTMPINFKQLGVALFVFAMGWSLANESRPPIRVVFNRYFPVFFYGLLVAICLSGIMLLYKNDLNLSNYLPLAGGINVVFNFFPANPTTWYIGTYLHLLLLWLLLSKVRIRPLHLILAFIAENIIRSTLLAANQDFIAYMLLTNWLSVFLIGMYLYQKQDHQPSYLSIVYFFALLALFLAWGQMANHLNFRQSFPFDWLILSFSGAVIIQSLLTSMLYIIPTVLFFALARYLPASNLIKFFSRNTLFIFIAHMPLVYAIGPDFYRLFPFQELGRIIFVIALYIALAFVSEALERMISISRIRDYAWSRLAAPFQKSTQ